MTLCTLKHVYYYSIEVILTENKTRKPNAVLFSYKSEVDEEVAILICTQMCVLWNIWGCRHIIRPLKASK